MIGILECKIWLQQDSLVNIFLLLLSFCWSDWLSTGLASSSKHSESITETDTFYHGVAMCSHWHFFSGFFTEISEHFCGYFRLHWSGYHWKDLFLLQNLSTNDANFDLWLWRQKRNKGQPSSQLVTASTGVSGLRRKILTRLSCWSQILHSRMPIILGC